MLYSCIVKLLKNKIMDFAIGVTSFVFGVLIGYLVTAELYNDKISFKYKMEHNEIQCDTLKNGNLHCYELNH